MAKRELIFKEAGEIASATEMTSKTFIDLSRKMPSNDHNLNKVSKGITSPNHSEWECHHCSGDYDHKYDNQQQVLQAMIVQGSGLKPIGSGLAEVIRLNWNKIFQIGSENAQSALKDLREKYSDV